MEKDILNKLKMDSRDEAVSFLKSLWNEEPQPCPLCDGKLDFLHKKAKRSNCDWICTVCGERYDTIKILNQLNDR
ncbi:MAG: hypothetical protein J6A37_01250 [Oscillospiraceae bacterium]|nr:hypothetical protein [Oscillospiraceae bacterium]MBQ6943515.1 hypothetical protein [Ruminococcus sp.]